MTQRRAWRAMSPTETEVIRSIVRAARLAGSEVLVDGLMHATVASATPWILDIRTPQTAAPCDLPDGPFPARAFVPNDVTYQGEVIIWLTDGRLSGLEYAWISDLPPTRWPLPDEMQVVSHE